MRPTQVTINLKALQHNLKRVRHYAPDSRVIAMVKANAYGHGMTQVVSALQEADAFGTCCLEEALVVREQCPTHPIILFEGFFDPAELALINEKQFELVIHHQWQLNCLKQAPKDATFKVWLKVDSGMRRLGFLPHEVQEAMTQLQAIPQVSQIRLMTHFANADDVENPATQVQTEIFNRTCEGFEVPRSLANSAGIVAWPATQAQWVRPGIMLYGSNPLLTGTAEHFQLQPAMTLTSQLIGMKQCKKDDLVGYGSTWRCPEDMTIGLIPIGYGDGYPRHVPNGTPVLINGAQVPLVGRVSMDLITVDLRACPQAELGDTVTLWGEGLPAETIAKHADTIAYELFCNVTPRVRRVYV